MRGSVEETLNELLEAEAQKLTHVARHEHNEQRQGYRSGHYSLTLTTSSGDVTLRHPSSRGFPLRPLLLSDTAVVKAVWKRHYRDVSGRRLRPAHGGQALPVCLCRLVAIVVNEDGYREVLGAAEGMKEDKAS